MPRPPRRPGARPLRPPGGRLAGQGPKPRQLGSPIGIRVVDDFAQWWELSRKKHTESKRIALVADAVSRSGNKIPTWKLELSIQVSHADFTIWHTAA
jgi:hypothetical protein